MEELDNILHEQIILAHRRLKQIKRLYKIMPDDRHLPELENMVQKKIQFLNDMMSEKQKKRKRKINIKRTFKHIVKCAMDVNPLNLMIVTPTNHLLVL